MEKGELSRFTLRVPVGLLVELKVLAARSRRSLNNQLVAMLETAVTSEQNEKSGTTA